MAATLAVVLAHQGGWDEALFVVVPIVVVVVVLRLAKRRVDAVARREAGADGSAGTDQPTERRSMSAPTDRNRPTRSS